MLTTLDHSHTHCSDCADALARITAVMADCETAKQAAYDLPRTCDVEQAYRAARLALVFARIAGCWRALDRTTRGHQVPRVFRTAVVVARLDARSRATFWRDIAAEWTARAEQRPTSDAAGALSNWHELGVSA